MRDRACGDTRVHLSMEVRRVVGLRWQAVKSPRREWRADPPFYNPFYTRRFSDYVGRCRRDSSLTAGAGEVHLDWKTVKDLDQQYMREQLRRVVCPGPWVLGIDDISLRQGHTYRIVVSDLLGGGVRSGLAARSVRKRAWSSSTLGWVPGNAAASGWR